ncbi:MAG: ABC transporter permease [Clostridia bacterium]|nr:ABC transporter permease [Clostridia bacterium]
MFNDYILILKKELTDIFRDRRSIVTLFIPVLLFPLMYFFMGTQLSGGNLTENIPCIVDCRTDGDRELYEAIFDGTNMIEEVDIQEDKYTDLKKGGVYGIIEIDNGKITVVFNQNSTKTLTSMSLINERVVLFSNSLFQQSLVDQDVDFEALDSLDYNGAMTDLSEIISDTGNSMMASIAPMMLVMVIMSGGVSVAVDLFAGEKEKGTFESLLTTQVSRLALLMAKFTAILIISLMSMVLSIAAYVISFKLNPSALGMYTGNLNADASDLQIITLPQVLQVLLVCFALSVFAVSVMTFIGINAKTVKEAQSQSSMITIIPTLLSGLTMFMDSANISDASMLIPVFNTIASIKMVFLGTVQPLHIVLSTVSCLAYSGVLWFLCVRMLNSEKLLRG